MEMNGNHILCLAAAALLALSCNGIVEVRPDLRQVPVIISDPHFGLQAKGLDDLTDTSSVFTSFGICAALDFDGVSPNLWYLPEQVVDRDPATRKCSFRKTAYWPLFGDLSFFAFTPISVLYQAGGTPEEIHVVETDTGFPAVEFTAPPDPSRQIDFCIGRPVMHRTREDNPVSVCFEHSLTKIWFAANYSGIIPSGYKIIIDELRIKNVIGTKKVRWSGQAPYFEWEEDGLRRADSSYVLKRSESHLREQKQGLNASAGFPPSDSKDLLVNSYGKLFLVPQTLGPEAKLEVVYSFYDGGDRQTAVFVKEIPLPEGQEWPGGKVVTYRLTVEAGISRPLILDCSIEEWSPSGNVHTMQELE